MNYKLLIILENVCPKTLKMLYFLIERLGWNYVHKKELIFCLLQDEEKSVKFSELWSGKSRIWLGKSVKSQGIHF